MKDYIEFYLVRHGETVSNIAKILQGQTESDLNELGRSQAAAAATRLAEVHFDACYSSSLRRAMETAQIILGDTHPGVSPIPTDGLKEWHLGELESRPLAELVATYPAVMQAFKVEEGDVQPPGGESQLNFLERIRQCMNSIASKHSAGERILLVSHGGALQMAMRTVLGNLAIGTLLPLASNASISVVRFYPDKQAWQLDSWNCTDHLRGLTVNDLLTY